MPLVSVRTNFKPALAPEIRKLTATPANGETLCTVAVNDCVAPCAGFGETLAGVKLIEGAGLVGEYVQLPSAFVSRYTVS